MRLSKWVYFRGIILLVCLIPYIGAHASAQDTSIEAYHLRDFNELRRDEAKAKPVYDYSIKRGSGTTLWQRIKIWFGEFIRRLFSSRSTGIVIQVIIYALIIAAVVFSILKFLGTNPASLLSKSKKQSLPYTVSEENIHELDFEKEIGIAIENHNYRLATRLFYLQALKLLADLEFIHWKPGKTNADYFYELKSGMLRSSFSSLGQMFEYAWYGGFKIEKSVMDRAREYFLDIKNQSQSKEPDGQV